MIVITLEGGLVQAVLSDDKTVRQQECVVVDYDADGSEDFVEDENGDECCPSRHKIGRLSKAQAKEVVKLTDEREAL